MGQFEFRRLKQWQTGSEGTYMELQLPLATSETGLVLRWCPNEECRPRRFQLGDRNHDELILDETVTRRQPRTAGTTCPYCGTDGDDSEFLAPEDLEDALAQVKWAVEQDMGEWMDDLTKDFNQKARRGSDLLGISMTSSHRSKPAPRPWREDLLRIMECHVCSRTYGVYAIGFFCPDCGCCTLASQFEREVALIVAQLDIAEQVAIFHSRELAYRLLGNAHEDVVTAFETYLKNSFRFASCRRVSSEEWAEIVGKRVRGNPFQNMERAERLFSILSLGLFADLDAKARGRLALNLEKRHVVGHNLGIADEKFAGVSESDDVGETVELLAHEIEGFARDCLQVIQRVEQGLPELHPGTA